VKVRAIPRGDTALYVAVRTREDRIALPIHLVKRGVTGGGARLDTRYRIRER